jgi:hypothetical protein
MSWIRPKALLRLDRGCSGSVVAVPLSPLDLRPSDRDADDHWRAYRPARTLPVLALPQGDHLLLIASNTAGRPTLAGTTTFLAQPI